MSDESSRALTAALIVRDEASHIQDCIASVHHVVDRICVADTGSRDETVALARAGGALVEQVAWTNDFASARNAVLAMCESTWVLSIDADERLIASRDSVLDFLKQTEAETIVLDVDNLHDQSPYTHPAVRVFRRDAVRWDGRVHEHLVRHNGEQPSVVHAPRDVMYLRHLGYEDAQTRFAKAARNASMAEASLKELRESEAGAPDAVAPVLLDLGRSYVGCDDRQAAVAVFETLREQFPERFEWLVATDFLARLCLARGEDEKAIELSEQLRSAGGSPSFCNWLAAQGHVQLGRFTLAQHLLGSVNEVIDTSGRRYDDAALAELKSLVDRLVAIAANDPSL